jgi:hypothetical protein
LLLAGCYSFTTLGRAHTVEQGKVELVAAPGVTGSLAVAGDPNVRPAIEVVGRYGLRDGIDAGLRVASSGVTGSLRVQLLRGSRIEALVAPGVAYTLFDKLALELPVAIGIATRGDDQIVIAPRVVYQVRYPQQFGFAGASLAYVWQLSRHVAVIPEVALLTTVYAEPGYGTFTTAGPATQAAIAIVWD